MSRYLSDADILQIADTFIADFHGESGNGRFTRDELLHFAHIVVDRSPRCKWPTGECWHIHPEVRAK